MERSGIAISFKSQPDQVVGPGLKTHQTDHTNDAPSLKSLLERTAALNLKDLLDRPAAGNEENIARKAQRAKKLRPPLKLNREHFTPARDLCVLPVLSIAGDHSAKDAPKQRDYKLDREARKATFPFLGETKTFLPIVNQYKNGPPPPEPEISLLQSTSGAIDMLIRKRIAMQTTTNPALPSNTFPTIARPGKLVDLIIAGGSPRTAGKKGGLHNNAVKILTIAGIGKVQLSQNNIRTYNLAEVVPSEVSRETNKQEDVPTHPVSKIAVSKKDIGVRRWVLESAVEEVEEENDEIAAKNNKQEDRVPSAKDIAETKKVETIEPIATSVPPVESVGEEAKQDETKQLEKSGTKVEPAFKFNFASRSESFPSFDFQRIPKLASNVRPKTALLDERSDRVVKEHHERKRAALPQVLRDWLRDRNLPLINTTAADSGWATYRSGDGDISYYDDDKSPSKLLQEKSSSKQSIYLSYCRTETEEEGGQLAEKLITALEAHFNVETEDFENIEVSLILICYNEAYGRSDACMSETMKMFNKNVPIVFVCLEANYEPTDWLLDFMCSKMMLSEDDAVKTITEDGFDGDVDSLLDEMRKHLAISRSSQRQTDFLPELENNEQ